MTMDLDSTVCQVHGYHKQGAAYGYTHTLGYHPLVATRADSGEVLHARQRSGGFRLRSTMTSSRPCGAAGRLWPHRGRRGHSPLPSR